MKRLDCNGLSSGRFISALLLVVTSIVAFAGCATKSNSVERAQNRETTTENTARSESIRGPVRVLVELKPNPAQLSDEPTLTIEVEHEPGISIEWPPFGESVGEFSILEFQQALPQSRGKRTVVRQVYRLEPTRTGTITIDPISIGYVDQRSGNGAASKVVETEALSVTITSILEAEAPSLVDLKPATGPFALDRGYRWIWWPLAGIALAGVILCFIMWIRRPRPIEAEMISPQRQARERLADLLGDDLAQRDVKEFYVRLTGIVRAFIERTRDVHAAEQTTEEFLREATSVGSFTSDERQRLKDFLESADLVKYAAHRPRAEDIEASVARAQAFMGFTSTESVG